MGLGRTRGKVMKKIVLLFGCGSLLLQAGPAKVVPTETLGALQVVPIDKRPHSAPEEGAGTSRKSSFSCLQFVAQEQRERANATSTSRPHSAESKSSERPGSVSPGTVLASIKIKGAKGRPVKTTIIIGGTNKDGEKTEKKESRSQVLMGQAGTIAEEQAAGTAEDGGDEQDSCMDKVEVCCSKIVKFVVGLVACL